MKKCDRKRKQIFTYTKRPGKANLKKFAQKVKTKTKERKQTTKRKQLWKSLERRKSEQKSESEGEKI